MSNRIERFDNHFKSIKQKVDKLLNHEDEITIVEKNEKDVTNVLVARSFDVDTSKTTGPGDSVLQRVSRGSFDFNMNWTDFFKFTKITSTIMATKHDYIPKVLDIGCRFAEVREIAYRNKLKIEYHGVDIDIAIQQKNMAQFTTENAFFYVLNMNDTFDFKQQFDYIILNDVIEHMNGKDNGYAMMNHVFKFLKPEGSIIITTPNSFEPDVLQYPNDHIYEFSLDELLPYFESLDFNVIELYGTNILMRHLKYVPEEKKHLIGTGFLSEILGCKNATMGLNLPEYSRHVYIHLKKK